MSNAFFSTIKVTKVPATRLVMRVGNPTPRFRAPGVTSSWSEVYRPSNALLVINNNAHKPRGREGWDDTSHCVVDAVAAGFGITWAESNELLAKLGRKKNRGISTWSVMGREAVQKYGEVREAKWFYQNADCGRWGRIERPCMTIATFLKKCDPTKRYVVTVTKHALAVVGGKVTGEHKLSRRIKKIWEVTPHLQRPGAINLPAIVNKNLTSVVACEKVSA